MTPIDQQINNVMAAISEIVLNTETQENLTKMDKLTHDSAKIMVKEVHLCILRHTYRIDNIRHNYDTMEELL
jgi:biotin synthase-related radical SAM superfamily protein